MPTSSFVIGCESLPNIIDEWTLWRIGLHKTLSLDDVIALQLCVRIVSSTTLTLSEQRVKNNVSVSIDKLSAHDTCMHVEFHSFNGLTLVSRVHTSSSTSTDMNWSWILEDIDGLSTTQMWWDNKGVIELSNVLLSVSETFEREIQWSTITPHSSSIFYHTRWNVGGEMTIRWPDNKCVRVLIGDMWFNTQTQRYWLNVGYRVTQWQSAQACYRMVYMIRNIMDT